MKRGEIWWADLADPLGSAPGFRRPVLVIQSDPFNASRIGTVVVAAITSNLSRADAPGNMRLSKTDSGLAKPSVVNVSQLLTVDRAILSRKVKSLPASAMETVDAGLKLVLGLN
ncbi:MAG TPA: type II toxin-antitoxin system PemK/MazF family toxin [Steroidobacteraceae bacterium]|nr:type II toxin-antitoxin system PemK/MazF family toxin [Steroidobacteraceae bacterium]